MAVTVVAIRTGSTVVNTLLANQLLELGSDFKDNGCSLYNIM